MPQPNNTMKANSDWRSFSNSLGVVRLILLVDWDPISIFGYAGAMDEYDRYAVKVHEMLWAGASQEALAAYLRFVQRELMETKGKSDAQLLEVAAKLQSVSEKVAED